MTSTETDTIVSPGRQSSPSRVRRILTGDRFCTKCGYNLVGQQIVREEHYSMLIVRCPECATVTGLEDYPRLGTWGARWGIVLAALWMILLVCLWPATSGIMLGFGVGIADEGSRVYGQHLERLQAASEAQSATSAIPVPATTPTPPLPMATIQGRTIVFRGGSPEFRDWWALQDQRAVLAAAGGWWGVTDRVEFLMLIPASAIVFLLGCLWSVFLIQLPRRRLVYCAAAIVGLACVFALIPLLEWDSRAVFSARRAAQYQLALPIFAITFAALIVPLSLGLRFGRSLAWLAVSALLPPKLRGPIAVLWAADSSDKRPLRHAE